MKPVIVVLAGGQGSRFWPVSRSHRPKQFLSISKSGESLIQATVNRVASLTSKENLWVLTTPQLQSLIVEHVPQAQLVIEPVARNTAACIGFAAMRAQMKDPEAVMVFLPADHAVDNEDILRKTLVDAISLASDQDVLVTVGIAPTHPHTGYGYIKSGKQIRGNSFKVDRFFEKPSFDRAKKYCESPGYSWNSGMFVWKARVILEAMREELPETFKGLEEIRGLLEKKGDHGARIEEIYSAFEPISIDFGVLEHVKNCAVVQSPPFGWNDVGSWDAWAEHFDKDESGNLVHGDALLINSNGCVVQSNSRFTAVVGAENLIVIDTGDAVLVCTRESVQDVRKVVDEIKRRGRNELV